MAELDNREVKDSAEHEGSGEVDDAAEHEGSGGVDDAAEHEGSGGVDNEAEHEGSGGCSVEQDDRRGVEGRAKQSTSESLSSSCRLPKINTLHNYIGQITLNESHCYGDTFPCFFLVRR